tara:strand:- start:1142 stop:2413 length:1272 start_codon:yes stop_codon:yes gene_type:complete
MPVRMTKKGRAETREDKRSEQANQQAMSAQAASSPSEGKGSKKAKEPKSPTERKNEKKAQIREARMTSTAKKYGERYTPGMLSGGQVKLDKNKDGKISGEDFKMMKRKRGGSTPGLKDYVKKSDSKEKMIKVIEDGITKFVKRSKVMDNPSKYTPAPSSMHSKEKSQGGSPFRKAIIERANKRSPGERFSEVDIEFAKQSLKRKGGGSAISKKKLKYTAANKGAMMNKSTKGYGAARTSGMGLQDEQVKPGKVQKAFLGVMAMKKAKKKGAKGAEFLSPALLAKRILGKKAGGPVGGSRRNPTGQQGRPKPGNMMNPETLAKLKQQLNRFKETSKKGGGADESKRMSKKNMSDIERLMERIGKLTPGGRMGSDLGDRLRRKRENKIMTPLKKMGGGMTMKKYNKGGSVTTSCKLGRNKATKLY